MKLFCPDVVLSDLYNTFLKFLGEKNLFNLNEDEMIETMFRHTELQVDSGLSSEGLTSRIIISFILSDSLLCLSTQILSN